MIAEFERALANALGARLPAPFQGRVDVAPLPELPPAIRLGAEKVEVLRPDFKDQRPELVPGSADPRRVVRATCTVSVAVAVADDQGREQQVLGIDAALFALDAPEFRDGSVLVAAGDPGFHVIEMRVTGTQAVLDPTARLAPPVALSLVANGWFWPVGVAGQSGIPIGEIRLRSGILPLELSLSRSLLVAGEGDVRVTLRIGAPVSMRVVADAAAGIALGPLALALVGPGGRPGAGTLSGGIAGLAGVRLVTILTGEAIVDYRPPAAPGTDTLVVGLSTPDGDLGIVLGRFDFITRAA